MTVKEADTEESMESSEGENNSSSAEPIEPTRTSEPAESVEPTQTPEPAEPTEPTQTSEPAEPIETAEPKQTQKPIETVKPAQTEKPAETPKATEIPAQPEAPVQPSRPEVPAQPSQPEAPIQTEAPSQPAHQHAWKDHVVTTQTWIPNIVVVEDYGEIPGEAYGVAICSCGYETEDSGAMSAHYKEGFVAGTCVNFWVETRYRESTYGVIGTHEEDQGHYETSSYVDYQYCDCGATK